MDIFLEYLLPIVATLLASLLTALTAYATAWLHAKTKREEQAGADAKTAALFGLATSVIEDVVAEVDQTEVADRRRHGPLTEGERDMAKGLAITNTKRNLGPAFLGRLNEALGGAAEEWIATKIEATVAKSKRAT